MTVVILSKTIANLAPCVDAVHLHEPDARIVVVDDGLEHWPQGVEVVIGSKPFIFARNANIGIQAADDDVILLNDDALLRTPRGFSVMLDQLKAHQEYGICGATCNNVGNTNQLPRGEGFRFEPKMVCFVCAAIPKSTQEKVGLLDERYVHYGWEDNDYCLRVRLAGLKVAITDNCYVDHGSLTSSFRGGARSAGDIRPNQAIYRAKWGNVQ